LGVYIYVGEIWPEPEEDLSKELDVAVVGSSVEQWSVADLAALYAEHRSSLVRQAERILRSNADAHEVVQEAFMKFILAAPELDSADRAMAYLRATVNNLSLNVIRATGARPHLVAIDSETSAERLAEIATETYVSAEENITAAEDAAIIRQALALLSPAERTALVMWEMDGRSTAEIAAELGIKESSVRHTVSRARASLRSILSTLIIDEERGLTALDLLSTSYKKAAELAKKSSRAALSLFLVVGAFLGFHAFTGHETKLVASTPVQAPVSSPALTTPSTPTHKTVVVQASSRKAQIASLQEQLQFAQVELSAQVDLLGVINDTNLFGQNTQVAALRIQPSTPTGGASSN
jgi:RNA polymerase sigma factor (sigma-70 family)